MYHILLNGRPVELPTALEEVTLQQRIDFEVEFGETLAAQVQEIKKIKRRKERERRILESQFDRAFMTLSLFTGMSPEALRDSKFVDELCGVYFLYMRDIFDESEGDPKQEFLWNGETWYLPTPELTGESMMKTKEVIYSKEHLRILHEEGANVYEQALTLAMIFLRKKDEPFQKEFIFQNSERYQLMQTLPLSIALDVAKFYGMLSEYLFDVFPIFWPGKMKSGPNAKKHYQEFGWINFLKTVAKTKAFDTNIPGMNSIQCVEEALAFDVFSWTSEDKGAAEAEYLDEQARIDEAERKRR